MSQISDVDITARGDFDRVVTHLMDACATAAAAADVGGNSTTVTGLNDERLQKRHQQQQTAADI